MLCCRVSVSGNLGAGKTIARQGAESRRLAHIIPASNQSIHSLHPHHLIAPRTFSVFATIDIASIMNIDPVANHSPCFLHCKSLLATVAWRCRMSIAKTYANKKRNEDSAFFNNCNSMSAAISPLQPYNWMAANPMSRGNVSRMWGSGVGDEQQSKPAYYPRQSLNDTPALKQA